MTLPTKAHYEEGHLVVKVERAAHTEGEGPAVAEVDNSFDLHYQY